MKKIQKEAKDRKSDLERLRVAVRELEEAEEEIAQLKRALAATSKEDNRLYRQEGKVDDEKDEDCEGNSVVESEAASKEEEERPVRRSSKVKMNAPGSINRRLVAVKNFTDDDDDDLHSTCVKSAEARRKLSSAFLREDDCLDTEEEVDYAPPPKAKRKCQTSSGARPRYADDLMARFQDFTPMGLGSNVRSSSGLPIDIHARHAF